MNLDSIHRLIEETQIFQMHQSSIKPHCDREAPTPSPRDSCGSCLPPCGLQSPAAHGFSAPPFNTNKWDICEELRLRELEEVKARAAQMEKTMRWWSDCTANWREKWSKVRAERNSAREEGRQLRIKLEMTMKELSALKKKQSLSLQKEAIEAPVTQGLEFPGPEGLYHGRDQFHIGAPMCDSIGGCLVKRQLAEQENTKSKEEGVVLDSLRLNEEMKSNPDCTDVFRNGGFGSCAAKPGLRLPVGNPPRENKVTKASAWQLPLGDFQEILWKERETRVALEKEIERLESALSLWKWKYEELKESRAAQVEESDILHGQHESEMGGMSGDIKEDSTSHNSKDRIICELRAELERLHTENTLEWDKRELLTTEKQELEKENRRLKVQVKEMGELLDRKNRLSESFPGPDFKTSYNELQEEDKVGSSWEHMFSQCAPSNTWAPATSPVHSKS